MPSAADSRLDLLSRASQAVAATLAPNLVVQRAAEALPRLACAQRGLVALLPEPPGPAQVAAARGLEPSLFDTPELRPARELVERAISSGLPQTVPGLSATGRGGADEGGLAGRSALAMPMAARGHTLGAVYVDRPLADGRFEQVDLDLLASFAGQVAVGVDNARTFELLGRRVQEVEALREYQDNILFSAGSAIVSLDASGHITSFNRAAERVFARPAEQALGLAYHQVLGPELSARLLRRMLRVMGQGERPDVLELDFPVAGRRTVLRINMSPLRQVSDGRALGLVLVADDLTETRLLEEARAREEGEKERIRSIFGRYVAPGVVEQLLAGREHLQLGGRRQEVSVIFADVRGYTTLAERLTPEEVVGLLNRYLAVATGAIFEYGGTLDKYMGDALMAMFNAPLPQPGHALAAVRSAWAMQRAVSELQAEGPSMAYGIGVSSGEAIVGNLGTEQLMNYTVIGDTVNVASRIQGLAPAGQVYLAEGTYQQVQQHVAVEQLPSVQVKGRQAPVAVYRLLGIRDE